MSHDTTELCEIQDCGRLVQSKNLCRTHYERLRSKGIYGGPIQTRGETPGGVCEIQDCDRPVRTKKLCKTHYARLIEKGIYGGSIKVVIPRPEKCVEDDCDNAAYAQERCRRHYDQWKSRLSEQPCAVDGCERFVFKRDWCRGHYDRWVRTGDPGSASFERTNKGSEKCSIDGCERPKSRMEWCEPHYRRWWRTGDVHEDQPFQNPKGTGYVDKTTGYRYINGAAEHRLVMEHILERSLVPGENVHHKNGIRHDNRPENLELWTTPQPTGIRNVDKLQHALELIELNMGNNDYAEAWRRVYLEQGLVTNASS